MKRLGSMEASQGKILAGVEELKKVVLKDEQKIESMEKKQEEESEKKEIVDISYPGDIVGLHDTGNFKIGDTLTSGEVLHYKGIPSFSPEHFRYIYAVYLIQ